MSFYMHIGGPLDGKIVEVHNDRDYHEVAVIEDIEASKVRDGTTPTLADRIKTVEYKSHRYQCGNRLFTVFAIETMDAGDVMSALIHRYEGSSPDRQKLKDDVIQAAKDTLKCRSSNCIAKLQIALLKLDHYE